MTTYASEPGTRLGGRYRLEDRIAAGSGWAAWKAIDETLARAVTVFTFAPGYPRVAEVVTAARAASRLSDPRLAHVFDVEDTWDRAYIVMEWTAGETLGDLLSHGPIEPFRAAGMIAEVASALSFAHASGVAHMCLSPGSVRWSQTGEVKVVGLGIDAALSGVSASDPVQADTHGLGQLLYAALTGHWPGAEYPPLRPAPVSGGEPCSPRQVVAGVPASLSELTCRAMQLRSSQGARPLTTPAELSRALLAAIPAALPPAPPASPSWRNQQPAGYQAETARYQSDPPYGQSRHDREDWDDRRPAPASRGNADWRDIPGRTVDSWSPEDALQRDGGSADARRQSDPGGRSPGRRRAPSRASVPKGLIAAAGALVLVAIAAFTIMHGGGGTPVAHHPTNSPSTPVTSATALTPACATGFDPLGHGDSGNENTKDAPLAIDSKAGTAWVSQWYATALFGGLKSGAGLMIDLGKQVRFSSVTVTFASQPGSDVKLLVGNSPAVTSANLLSMTPIAAKTNVSGNVPFSITSAVKGQYLVIWFTKLPLTLPKQAKTKYAAEVFNVIIHGTS